jgi:hypothetical protein
LSPTRELAKLNTDLGIRPMALDDLRYVAYAENGGRIGTWQKLARELFAERPPGIETINKIGVLEKSARVARWDDLRDDDRPPVIETITKVGMPEKSARAAEWDYLGDAER